MEKESTVVGDRKDKQKRRYGEGEYSCRRSERQAGEEELVALKQSNR